VTVQKDALVAVECIEALLRGESLDESIDAQAGVFYLVASIEHVKKRLDKLAGYQVT